MKYQKVFCFFKMIDLHPTTISNSLNSCPTNTIMNNNFNFTINTRSNCEEPQFDIINVNNNINNNNNNNIFSVNNKNENKYLYQRSDFVNSNIVHHNTNIIINNNINYLNPKNSLKPNWKSLISSSKKINVQNKNLNISNPKIISGLSPQNIEEIISTGKIADIPIKEKMIVDEKNDSEEEKLSNSTITSKEFDEVENKTEKDNELNYEILNIDKELGNEDSSYSNGNYIWNIEEYFNV